MQSPFSFGRTVQDLSFTNRSKEIQRLKSNVNKVKETLLNREIIDIQLGKVEFIDPAYELWFRKNILKKPIFIEKN